MNGVTYSDKPIEKLYYSITEIAAELHISVSCVRFWCGQFNLQVKRNRHGNRMFTIQDRITMREIYFLLKVEGMTIWGARKKFESQQ